MRTPSRRAGVAVVAVLGLAGLGLAHVLQYLALVPDAHNRAHVLADTGHQYLPSALGVVVFLAVAAVAAVFLRGFARPVPASAGASPLRGPIGPGCFPSPRSWPSS